MQDDARARAHQRARDLRGARAGHQGLAATAHVDPISGAPSRPQGERLRALRPDGFVVDSSSGAPVVVPFAHVRAVSTYDHVRGARNGALGLGLPALIVGGLFGYFANAMRNACADCPQHDGTPLVFGYAAIFGLSGVVLGGGLGALAGYEDRYTIAPE